MNHDKSPLKRFLFICTLNSSQQEFCYLNKMSPVKKLGLFGFDLSHSRRDDVYDSKQEKYYNYYITNY